MVISNKSASTPAHRSWRVWCAVFYLQSQTLYDIVKLFLSMIGWERQALIILEACPHFEHANKFLSADNDNVYLFFQIWVTRTSVRAISQISNQHLDRQKIATGTFTKQGEAIMCRCKEEFDKHSSRSDFWMTNESSSLQKLLIAMVKYIVLLSRKLLQIHATLFSDKT